MNPPRTFSHRVVLLSLCLCLCSIKTSYEETINAPIPEHFEASDVRGSWDELVVSIIEIPNGKSAREVTRNGFFPVEAMPLQAMAI